MNKKKRSTPPRSKELLEDFIKYCERHPGERFWQALTNWAGVEAICLQKNKYWAGKIIDVTYIDTFFFNNKNK